MLPELNERLDNTLQFLELLKHDQEMATLLYRPKNWLVSNWNLNVEETGRMLWKRKKTA